MNSLHVTFFGIALSATVAYAADPSPRMDVKTITNSIGIKLIRIESGSFPMGSPVLALGTQEKLEYPEHRVRISQTFYIGLTEVTQGQWQAVMGTQPWRESEPTPRGLNYPATSISWDDAVTFCKRLTAKEDVRYRLPTEAEWEFTCRAGSTSDFFFGDDENLLAEYGWCAPSPGPSPKRNHAQIVGTRRPNPWGVYDMHGNVWEWCHDRFGTYEHAAVVDPMGPAKGLMRVYRGGSWASVASDCRSPYRRFSPPKRHFPDIGFRIARDEAVQVDKSASTR
jgi:formylglycine-generating enzyme required for sulfatase activity